MTDSTPIPLRSSPASECLDIAPRLPSTPWFGSEGHKAGDQLPAPSEPVGRTTKTMHARSTRPRLEEQADAVCFTLTGNPDQTQGTERSRHLPRLAGCHPRFRCGSKLQLRTSQDPVYLIRAVTHWYQPPYIINMRATATHIRASTSSTHPSVQPVRRVYIYIGHIFYTFPNVHRDSQWYSCWNHPFGQRHKRCL